MKRTLAFILTMLMVVTMIPASLLSAMARGRGVAANSIENQTVSNAPGQYIPETIVVDGKVRDTGWPYDDWNRVNTETGTWNVQDVSEENLDLLFSYQLKTDYYFLYGAFIMEKEVEGPLTIWLNNGTVNDTYTHKFVIDLEDGAKAKRYDAAGNEITNVSPNAYEQFICMVRSPAPGRTVVEFKSLLADFCAEKNPNISYFVSLQAADNQSIYHPAIKAEIANRDSYFPSLSGQWPEGAGVISVPDIHGVGENSLHSAINVDGYFNEAIFADHTNFYSVWYERLNVVNYKNRNDKPYSDLVYNKTDYANGIGGEHDVRVSASKFHFAALIQDDNNNGLSYYDTVVIVNLYQYVNPEDTTQGANQLQITMRKDFTDDATWTSSSAVYTPKGGSSTNVTSVGIVNQWNGTDYYGLKWGAISTGAPNTYSFEFAFDRIALTNVNKDFVPDYYDIFLGGFPEGSTLLPEGSYATGGGYPITYYRNPIGEYHEPYTTYSPDGYLGTRAWPGLTFAASTVNSNLIDNDETHGGTRVRGIDYLHTMAVDYEFAYGAVHITNDGSGTFNNWKHGNAQNPNGADFFSVVLTADDGVNTYRYDMWTYEEGGTVKAAIGKFNGNNVAYEFSDELVAAFVSSYDEELKRNVYAFEYQVSLHGIGVSLDYNISTADRTDATEIFDYHVMFNIVNEAATSDAETYAAHTNYVWPKSGNTVMPGADGFDWTSNPAVVRYNSVVRAVECDGRITEELRLQLEKVDYSNSSYRDPSLDGNVLGGYKKMYVGHDYLYLSARIDGDLRAGITKGILWVKTSDGTIKSYTFLHNGTNNVSLINGTQEYIQTSAYAMTTANGATNLEVVFPISHIDPNRQGFEYFIEVEQKINDEVLNRVSPAPVVQQLDVDTYATYFDLSGSEWKKHAGEPTSLVYFFPEEIDVDGDLMDSGWDQYEWIFVSPDINASKQETNEITQLFKSDFYYQMRFDDEYVYVAAVIQYYDGTNPDTGDTIAVSKDTIYDQEPSFRLWLKKGMNGSDTTVGASNSYTSYYNLQRKQDGRLVITTQNNTFPTYANNTRPLYDKYYVPVIPQKDEDGKFIKGENGEIEFVQSTDGTIYPTRETFSTENPNGDPYTYGPNDSLLFGYTEYTIDENEAVIVKENGQTFGECINPEDYAANNMLAGEETGVEAGVLEYAEGKTFKRNGTIVTLDYHHVVVEMKVKISEYKLDQFFQYYVSTGMHAPSWNGSKATVYPSIAVEPNSGDNYFHKNFPYWFWKDGSAVNVTDSLRQDMTLRTYKKPVITLGAKVNQQYNYYDEASGEVREDVNAIRFGGLWTEEYIRKVNGLMENDGYNNGNYTDYWDVKHMGMVVLATHKVVSNDREDAAHPGRYDLFVDTPGAQVIDADGIVNWAGPQLGNKNNFADYTDFAFYVTVANIPDKMTGMNFCFRGFVSYYDGVNASIPYYDVILSRSIDMVVDQATNTGKFDWAESGALEDGTFLDQYYKPGTGAIGSDKVIPGGNTGGGEEPDPDDPDNPDDPVVPNDPPQPDVTTPIDYVNIKYYDDTLNAVTGAKLFASSTHTTMAVLDDGLGYGWWYATRLTYDETAQAYKVVDVKATTGTDTISNWSVGGNDVVLVASSGDEMQTFIAGLTVGEYVQITGKTLAELKTHKSTAQETTIGIGKVDVTGLPQDVVINSIEVKTEGSLAAGNKLFAVELESINGDTSLVGTANSAFGYAWYDLDVNVLDETTTTFVEGTEYDLFVVVTRADGYVFADNVTYTLTTADGTYEGQVFLPECTDDVNAFDFYVTALPGTEEPGDEEVITVDNINDATYISDRTTLWASSAYASRTDLLWSSKALLEYDDNEDNYKVIAVEGTNSSGYEVWDYGIDRVILSAHGASNANIATIAALQVGQRLTINKTLAALKTASGLEEVEVKVLDVQEEVIKAPDVEAITLPGLVPNATNGEKVAYVPLDNRPVHKDRVIYQAAAAGVDLVMPSEADYATVLTDGYEHGGNPANILAWLQAQEAAGVDYYVIALDQVFSGGLVASREGTACTTADGSLSNHDKAAVKFLIQLAKENYVVYTDTIIRLAMTTSGYVNYGPDDDRYYALRNYGISAREILGADGNRPLTLDNVISAYRYDSTGVNAVEYTTNGDYTVTEAELDALLNARERKLRITDALIRGAGDNINRLIIGLDDTNAVYHNIQSNERAYIEKLAIDCGMNSVTNPEMNNMFTIAGCDEMGLMGIASLVNDVYLPEDEGVVIQFVTSGDTSGAADTYDSGSLSASLIAHMNALGVTRVQVGDAGTPDIKIFVLGRGGDTAALVSQIKECLDANIGVAIIDASKSSGEHNNLFLDAMTSGGVFDREDAGEILAFSHWNTVGNLVGISMSNAISRYAYLKATTATTTDADYAFLQSLLFSYIKDAAYKPNQSLYWNYQTYAWPLMNTLQGSFKYILGKNDGVITSVATGYTGSSIDNVVWPWGRAFECTFTLGLW